MSDAERLMIYEVSVVVPAELREYSLKYMTGRHIAEVLEHSAFSHALFLQDLDCPADEFHWCTQYFFKSRELLEDYFQSSAPQLREDFIKTFAGYDVRVTRRIMEGCKIVLKH